MNINEFKAGRWLKQFQYESFSPSRINQEWSWDDPKINALLERATQALGELNAYSSIVPDVDLFIQMHVAKEASMSSRIEGTQTEMDEALRPREFVDPERRDDWQEVQNYIAAMNGAMERLESLPLSNRLICETHATLMTGVRGENKYPGEYRRSQNWIGGSGPGDAAFVPPVFEEIPDLMSDLQEFWHNETIYVPHLIRAALSHYQFETIHPFCDGNGRIGRLLIPLYLISKGLLKKPTLYLSAHLEKHKGAYYDALTRVRASNDLGHWLRFFLTAVWETSNRGAETFDQILSLRSEVEKSTLTLGRKAENARKLLDFLYRYSVVTPNCVAELLEISHTTASNLIRDFQRLDILEEVTGFQRNRIYIFMRYMRLFSD